MGGIAKRIAAAFGANVVGRILNIVIQAVAVSLFVKFWGIALYGQWLMLTAIPAYLVASDLGFAAAAANEMAIEGARGNFARAKDVFRQCLGLILIACSAVLLIGVAFTVSVDTARLLDIDRMAAPTVRLIVFVLFAQVATSLPGELLLGGFRAAGRYALGLMIGNLCQLFEFLLVAAGLVLSASPLTIALLTLGGRLIRTIATAVLMQRVLRWRSAFRPIVSAKVVKELGAPALGFATFPLSRALGAQGMILLIGNLLGAPAVVVFTAARTMCRAVSAASDLVANSIYSEVSTAFGANKTAVLAEIQYASSQVAAYVAALSGIAVILLRSPISSAWVSGQIVFPLGVLLPLLWAEGAGAVSRVNLVILTAANRHMRTALMYLAQSIVTLLLAYVLIRAFALSGAALSVAASETAILAVTAAYATRSLGNTPMQLYRKIVVPPWRPAKRALLALWRETALKREA